MVPEPSAMLAPTPFITVGFGRNTESMPLGPPTEEDEGRQKRVAVPLSVIVARRGGTISSAARGWAEKAKGRGGRGGGGGGRGKLDQSAGAISSRGTREVSASPPVRARTIETGSRSAGP